MKKNIFLIIIIAFLMPFGTFAQTLQQSLVPTQTNVIKRQPKANVCDSKFEGEKISFTATAELALDQLLDQIHRRFDVNFLIGNGIKDLPINIRSGSLPWNVLLDSQLYLSGVSKRCINANTILLVKNEQRKTLEKDEIETAELRTEFIKLKYLQPTTSGTVNVAGQSTNQGNGGQQCGGNSGGNGGNSGGNSGNNGGCGTFEKLKYEIERILGINHTQTNETPTRNIRRSDGGITTYNRVTTQKEEPLDFTDEPNVRGAVAVIPGRNILVVKGTEEQLKLIKEFVRLADRAPFQVVIKGLVYTANENLLRDIGVQTNIVASTADGRSSSSIFGNPISGAGTLFDFSALIGTVDFNVQASALESKGIISIKSRPFAVVLDGDTADLSVGRQIPVLTLGQISGESGRLEILNAANLLKATPYVIDDDNGKPVGVNLTLQLASNDVDTSVISQGVPSINTRSIQTRLLLTQEKTVVLGGFTVDTNSRDVSKTPGLGDIPILGYLFKRKVKREELNRLYFAISISIVPYGSVIEPVNVPSATTEIPTVSPSVLKIEKP